MARRLRQEVIAPQGPWLKKATAVYRNRRKAVERGTRFMNEVRVLVQEGRDAEASEVVFELWLLLKALEDTL